MRFEEINFSNDEEFLRFTGIEQSIFNKMLDILKEAELKKFKKEEGLINYLLEKRILMTLSYWLEYRTYFHTGKSFGISETNCYRNIVWIEDVLIKHPDFQKLFGQKALIKDCFSDKSIIIDATESPIKRPKKTKAKEILFRKKEKTYNKNTSNNWKWKWKYHCYKFCLWQKTWFSLI